MPHIIDVEDPLHSLRLDQVKDEKGIETKSKNEKDFDMENQSVLTLYYFEPISIFSPKNKNKK